MAKRASPREGRRAAQTQGKVFGDHLDSLDDIDAIWPVTGKETDGATLNILSSLAFGGLSLLSADNGFIRPSVKTIS